MTQWGYEDNDNAGQDNDTELNGPKALRDAYAALKKQNEETTAMVRELLNEKKQSQIAAVFESLGAPQAAKVYTGEPDPAKAKEWFDTMSSVFGNGSVPGSNPATAVDSTPAISPEQQAQLQRMTEAGQSGVPMGNMDAAFAAVNGADNLKDLIAGFQNASRTQ